MNAHVMRKSPSPRPRGGAAAFPPLVIPHDTPGHARSMLTALDAAITREAEATLVTSPPPDISPDLRLAIAGRMHARADGATAFFLFHYLRLLDEQAGARRGGSPSPVQNWAMPDWSPPPPANMPHPASRNLSCCAADAALAMSSAEPIRCDCAQAIETS